MSPQTPVSAAPPIRTPFFPQIGTVTKDFPAWFNALMWTFTFPWIAWFQYVGNQLNKASLNVPPTSSAPGKAGMLALDANFIYACVKNSDGTVVNAWKRAALNAF